MNWVPLHILTDEELQREVTRFNCEQRCRTFLRGVRSTNPQLELDLVGGKNPNNVKRLLELDSGL